MPGGDRGCRTLPSWPRRRRGPGASQRLRNIPAQRGQSPQPIRIDHSYFPHQPILRASRSPAPHIFDQAHPGHLVRCGGIGHAPVVIHAGGELAGVVDEVLAAEEAGVFAVEQADVELAGESALLHGVLLSVVQRLSRTRRPIASLRTSSSASTSAAAQIRLREPADNTSTTPASTRRPSAR